MQAAALDWLNKNHEEIVRGLADLVAIQSISTDGEHNPEIDRTAKLTCDQMRQAGLHNVDVLRVGQSLPYAYGEWLEAGPNKPTVFLYAHHDVQPVNFVEQWLSDPWKLTRATAGFTRAGPPTTRPRSRHNSARSRRTAKPATRCR